MAAVIEFPDGVRAYLSESVWDSPDPQVKAVVEFFSEQLPFGYYPAYETSLAKFVVSQIKGAKIISVERREPLPYRPEVDY